jgi:YegS/Rv2252/BmrU family lipid kinase
LTLDMPEPRWRERKEAVVIVNPTARKLPSQQRLKEARDWLAERGWEVEWIETGEPGHATSLAGGAAERGVPLLFVCGGDGTLNDAVNGLAGSETAVAVIPAGTVNLWAREVGLLKRPIDAVRLAAEGVPRRVDLGIADSRYFLLVAGFGLDGAVARGVSERLKERFGATAYALSAARQAFSYRPSSATLSLDGERRVVSLLMLVAGNTRNYAGLTQITSAAMVDDGWLDVCAYTGRGRWDILRLALLTLLRQHRRSKNVLYKRARRLGIESLMPLSVQLDGDAHAGSPVEVSVAPSALWVAVPRTLKSPLFSRPRGQP